MGTVLLLIESLCLLCSCKGLFFYCLSPCVYCVHVRDCSSIVWDIVFVLKGLFYYCLSPWVYCVHVRDCFSVWLITTQRVHWMFSVFSRGSIYTLSSGVHWIKSTIEASSTPHLHNSFFFPPWASLNSDHRKLRERTGVWNVNQETRRILEKESESWNTKMWSVSYLFFHNLANFVRK